MTTGRVIDGLGGQEPNKNEQSAQAEIDQCAKAIDIILKGFVRRFGSEVAAKIYLDQANELLQNTNNKEKIETFRSGKLWELITKFARGQKCGENTQFIHRYMDLVLEADDNKKPQLLKDLYKLLPTENDGGAIPTKSYVNIDHNTKVSVLHKSDGALKNASELTAADIYAIAVCGSSESGGPVHMLAGNTMSNAQLAQTDNQDAKASDAPRPGRP